VVVVVDAMRLVVAEQADYSQATPQSHPPPHTVLLWVQAAQAELQDQFWAQLVAIVP
jgi:hypothetical protein